MGLLEGYFVPLYNFFLTPENFDQKVKDVTDSLLVSFLVLYWQPPAAAQAPTTRTWWCLWRWCPFLGHRPEFWWSPNWGGFSSSLLRSTTSPSRLSWCRMEVWRDQSPDLRVGPVCLQSHLYYCMVCLNIVGWLKLVFGPDLGLEPYVSPLAVTWSLIFSQLLPFQTSSTVTLSPHFVSSTTFSPVTGM